MISNSQSCDVSVMIPTFNRLSFLKESLQSVLDQACRPKEIFIIDDGSQDGTSQWVRDQGFPGVQLLTQKNQGPAAARNLGATRATGKYLAFLDSDDRWLPTKLAVQVEFLEKNPDIKLCQTEEIWIRNGVRVNPKKKHQKPSGNIFISCLKLCLISPSAVMMRRDFFKRLGGFDSEFPVCEDYELWLRATLRSQVHTLPEALTVKVGGHADQLSKQVWGMDRYRIRAMEKVLATEDLTKEQKTALLRELTEKLSIMSLGFAKRYPKQENPYQKRLKWLKNPEPSVRGAAPWIN